MARSSKQAPIPPMAARIMEHQGCKLESVYYGDPKSPASVTIECEACGVVVIDAMLEGSPPPGKKKARKRA